MRDSQKSSRGSVYSSRKKGWLERLPDGEGDGIETGVEAFELGESYPSISYKAGSIFDMLRAGNNILGPQEHLNHSRPLISPRCPL
jgi:hypothetical protein